MVKEHWFRWWLGAMRHPVVAWICVYPDLQGHMASLGHNELIVHTEVTKFGICFLEFSPLFLAITKQPYESFSPVRLSIRLSVAHFSKCSHHHVIMKFPGVITIDKCDVHAKVKVRGQRSRSQTSKQISPQFGSFWTVTPLWIHRWL